MGLNKIIAFINRKTGYRYWFTVKLVYRNKNGYSPFDITSEIGVAYKDLILNHRDIKKSFTPIHKINGVQKKNLQNGTCDLQIISYIGYLKRPLKPLIK